MSLPDKANLDPYILVVDDDKEFCKALKEILNDDGYQVLIAGNGEEAFRLTKKYGVQLIISDIRIVDRRPLPVGSNEICNREHL